MRYQRLGCTGLYVSELCLGTMTYGGKGFWEVIGKLGASAVTGQLRTALDAGVNFIDTADVYHEGESEKLVGQALHTLAVPRDQIVIATKVFGRTAAHVNGAGLSRKHIFDSIDASLRRLGLDYIDLYQTHGLDPLTPIEETLDALDTLVQIGKVRYLGFCNLPAWKAAQALGVSDRNRQARFVSAQMFYAIAARDIEREIVPLAVDEGLAILPWSPLAGGLLSGKFSANTAAPADARRAQFDFPLVDKPRAFACVDAMRSIATERGASVAQVALAYLLAKPHVTSVIIGAKTDAQLADNLGATKLQLSADELAALDKVSALPSEYPGWMNDWQMRTRLIDGQQR